MNYSLNKLYYRYRQIYGGVAMGVAAVALISIFALGNVRVCP